jgi:hypothetical protein
VKQITPPVTPQVLEAQLMYEREEWLRLHERAQRAGGLCLAANAAEEWSMERINWCLDYLGALVLHQETAV